METKLYNGQITLEFDESRHLYTVGGNPVISVTGALSVFNKPALMPWVAKMCGEYLADNLKPGESYDEIQIENMVKAMKSHYRNASRNEASIGTLVHEFAEKVATGEPVQMPVNKQAQKGCDAFMEWWDAHDIEVNAAEFKVFSIEDGFCGTCDLDATIDGKRTIADFKTSSGIYGEMHLQTAGYAKAREEELYGPYDQRMIIQFNKATGKFDPKKNIQVRNMADEFEADYDGFAGALDLYRWQQGMKK